MRIIPRIRMKNTEMGRTMVSGDLHLISEGIHFLSELSLGRRDLLLIERLGRPHRGNDRDLP